MAEPNQKRKAARSERTSTGKWIKIFIRQISISNLAKGLGVFQRSDIYRLRSFLLVGSLMTHPKEAIEAAAKYQTDKIDFRGIDTKERDAFLAGDANGYARAQDDTPWNASLIIDYAKRIEELEHLLENIRSQMCWERDRDQLSTGFVDLHDAVTKALEAKRSVE